MIIEEPSYLYALLVLPLLVVLLGWYLRWQKTTRTAFANAKIFEKITGKDYDRKNNIRNILYLVVIGLLIVALANPKYGEAQEVVKSKGADVIFAIDISKSMLAEDVAPNRLEKSKQITNQIINKLQGDRVGLVAYSGSAFNVMPITTDYNVAKMFVKNMSPTLISEQGTALDQAIEVGTKAFNTKSKSNKVIVIFSDGEDHSDNAESAASSANKDGVKIITVGVGTEKGSPIPIKENGLVVGFKHDNENNVVVSKRNATVLQTVAKATGETYIDGNASRAVVEQVISRINNYQKTNSSVARSAGMKSSFQWFLGLAFVLLLIDVFVLDKKSRG